MRSVKFLLAAGAATLMSSVTLAADLPIAPPPAYLPPPPQDFGGWYLRGDIGMSSQKVKSLYNVLGDAPGVGVQPVHYSFDSAGFYGLGVGYTFNNWLRADITGEYRGRANFHGLEIITLNGTVHGTDEYRASKSEWLFLANAYVDLGTWMGVTPFIGAGVGTSRNTISNFVDINTPNGGVAFAEPVSKWQFAYAAYAGLSYAVTPNVTVELAYRYLNLGDGMAGDIVTYQGVNNVYNPTEFREITSHDVKLGVRWSLNPAPVYLPPPPPLMTKG